MITIYVGDCKVTGRPTSASAVQSGGIVPPCKINGFRGRRVKLADAISSAGDNARWTKRALAGFRGTILNASNANIPFYAAAKSHLVENESWSAHEWLIDSFTGPDSTMHANSRVG